MWKQHYFSFFKAISVTYNFRSVFNQQLFANRDVIMVACTNNCVIESSNVTTTTTATYVSISCQKSSHSQKQTEDDTTKNQQFRQQAGFQD